MARKISPQEAERIAQALDNGTISGETEVTEAEEFYMVDTYKLSENPQLREALRSLSPGSYEIIDPDFQFRFDFRGDTFKFRYSE